MTAPTPRGQHDRDPRLVPDENPPPSLVEWLRARLDEDERRADDLHDTYSCGRVSSDPATPFPCDCGYPARVLAEVAAKRQQIDMTFRYEAKIDGEWGCAHRTYELDVSISPVLAELEVPASGVGWVKSELHEGEDASRAIVLWHNGEPMWVSGERRAQAGTWVGVELPIEINVH